MDTFQALVARQDGDQITTAVEILKLTDLPPGEVTIRVLYSSVNFKDALALTPGGGVVRNYPMVPGVEAAPAEFRGGIETPEPGRAGLGLEGGQLVGGDLSHGGVER